MRKKLLLLLACLFIGIGLTTAQNSRKVTGLVLSSEDGQPIVGATVAVVGANKVGVVTDVDGRFSFNVPISAKVLRVSYVGMTTKTVAISSNMRIVLDSDTQTLGEVVVTGYGSARKLGAIAGSVATVSALKLEKKPIANIADALQGQVAGLQVFTSSGEPTAGVSMRIRGISSISASTTPLFILDGSPISSGAFTALNPNDIESMTVLKDASATAIYGSRAANGVVIMTTKRGLRGEHPRITVNAQYGFSKMTGDHVTMMNAEQWLNFQEILDPTKANDAAFQTKKKFYVDNHISTDWSKVFFGDTKPTAEVSLDITGGSDNTSYYLSADHYKTDGIMDDSNMRRETIRSRVDTSITNWLKAGVNMNLSYTKYATSAFSGTSNSVYNKVYASRIYLPTQSYYQILTDASGKFTGYGNRLDYFDDLGYYNPYYLSEIQPSTNDMIRLNANTYFNINPIKGLNIRAQQAVEAYDYRLTSMALPVGPFDGAGTRTEGFQRYYQFTYTNTAEYKFSINRAHNFTALIGQESIISKNDGFRETGTGLTDVNLMLLSAAAKISVPNSTYTYITQTVFNSYFATLNYDYLQKYFVDLSIRRDGSSLFGENNKWATFWSAGAMWNLKREAFMRNIKPINDLQLKVSYGVTGNSGIDPYSALGLVSTGPLYNGVTGVGLSQMANPDLSWEKVKTFNVALIGKAFNIFNWDIEYYNRATEDMLMSVPISMTTGYNNANMNVASMQNRGIDVTLGADIIKTKDLFWSASVNFNYNKNKITKLFQDQDEYVLTGTGLKLQKGKPYGEFYQTRWLRVDPKDGYNVWLDKNGNETKVYSDDDAVFTGKQQYAPWEGGFSTHVDYKGIYMDANFSGIFGRYMTNNERYFSENAKFATADNQTTHMFDMWRKAGDITDIPNADSNIEFDTHLLENASFVRLKSLTIGYSFPQKLLMKTKIVRGAKIYFVGRNLLTFTSYKGYDPEVDTNVTLGRYPNTKQYSFGLELTF